MSNFGKATPAIWQRPLNPVAKGKTHSAWIVALFDDESYSLVAVSSADVSLDRCLDSRLSRPYKLFWSDLADLCWDETKAWLVGWRTRYALDRADFMGALEDGQAVLPRIKDGKNKGKHGGKLTLNRRILDIDIECGKNRVKILEWENFGVKADHFGVTEAKVTVKDAVHVLKAYLDAMRAVGVAVDKTTAAQLGWSHFRRDCQPNSMAINLDNDTRAMERRAYHGGRNECYRLGDIPGQTYSLDVRSCYANICANLEVPAWLDCEYKDGIDVRAIEATEGYQWIADVEIKTSEPDYPLSWGNTPIYPVGHFSTSLAWPELLHALANKRVVKATRAARYVARPVFREFAFWYMHSRLALANCNFDRLIPALKATFNASLGYTARQKYEWVPIDVGLGAKYWIGLTNHPETHEEAVALQKLDDETRWLKIAGEPREAMPFLHATICSWARIHLLSLFAALGRENILYVDTDGIICNEKAYKRAIADPQIYGPDGGQLATRFPAGPCRIQGQKSYQIGDNFVQAGLVRSQFSAMKQRRVLTTDTGLIQSDGRVIPFTFRCNDGVNEMV